MKPEKKELIAFIFNVILMVLAVAFVIWEVWAYYFADCSVAKEWWLLISPPGRCL